VTVVDAHQHLWNLERVEYPWLTAEYGPIFRTFEESELEPQLAAAGVDRTVIVQSADSAADTDFMFEVADRWARIAGIVGWVPLGRPEDAATELDRRCGDPRFVGVRHLIHTEPDPDWLLREPVLEGLGLLAQRGLTFDVVAVLPRHLEHVTTLAERYPSLRFVIDHLAKPPIMQQGWQPWSELLERAAAHPNVFAKLSGLNTAADPQTWTAADLQPYVDRALELFGPSRLMYGGDWPVAILAGDYAKVWSETTSVLSQLDQADRDLILGGTATDFYRLPPRVN
jgi:L-fuconolactonase